MPTNGKKEQEKKIVRGEEAKREGTKSGGGNGTNAGGGKRCFESGREIH